MSLSTGFLLDGFVREAVVVMWWWCDGGCGRGSGVGGVRGVGSGDERLWLWLPVERGNGKGKRLGWSRGFGSTGLRSEVVTSTLGGLEEVWRNVVGAKKNLYGNERCRCDNLELFALDGGFLFSLIKTLFVLWRDYRKIVHYLNIYLQFSCIKNAFNSVNAIAL